MMGSNTRLVILRRKKKGRNKRKRNRWGRREKNNKTKEATKKGEKEEELANTGDVSRRNKSLQKNTLRCPIWMFFIGRHSVFLLFFSSLSLPLLLYYCVALERGEFRQVAHSYLLHRYVIWSGAYPDVECRDVVDTCREGKPTGAPSTQFTRAFFFVTAWGKFGWRYMWGMTPTLRWLGHFSIV